MVTENKQEPLITVGTKRPHEDDSEQTSAKRMKISEESAEDFIEVREETTKPDEMENAGWT